MRKFIDERYFLEIITEEELRREFKNLKKIGETEMKNFNDYLSVSLLWNNGTLSEVIETESKAEAIENFKNGLQVYKIYCDGMGITADTEAEISEYDYDGHFIIIL